MGCNEAAAADHNTGKLARPEETVDCVPGNATQKPTGLVDGVECAVLHDAPETAKGERTASYSPSRAVKAIDTAARITLPVAHMKRKPGFPIKMTANLKVGVGVSGQNVGKLNFLARADASFSGSGRSR